MSLKNSTDRRGGISQPLHWTIAVLILTIGAVGLLMGELPRSPKWFWVYTAHKSLGLTVLVLVIAAISVSGPIDRMGRRPGARWATDLLAASEALTRRL